MKLDKQTFWGVLLVLIAMFWTYVAIYIFH